MGKLFYESQMLMCTQASVKKKSPSIHVGLHKSGCDIDLLVRA